MFSERGKFLLSSQAKQTIPKNSMSLEAVFFLRQNLDWHSSNGKETLQCICKDENLLSPVVKMPNL